MTSLQEAQLKASLSSHMYLTLNTSIVSSIPGITGLLAQALTINGQIQAASIQQEIDKSGNTGNKKFLRTNVITLSIDIVRRISAYAMNVNNLSLMNLIDYSESDLKQATDQNLVSICQIIRDSANTNLTALATYGVTAAMITALQTAITNFNNSIAKIRLDAADSGMATKLIASSFKLLLATWTKIDTLVEIVRISQPNFYAEYVKVRKAIVAGNGSLDLKIKATNMETGMPEALVTLTLAPTNGTLKAMATGAKTNIVKKTYKGGSCHYKNIPDGTYSVLASKTGFKDVMMTINIVKGEMCVLNIEMERV
jgi:hypothetical protein